MFKTKKNQYKSLKCKGFNFKFKKFKEIIPQIQVLKYTTVTVIKPVTSLLIFERQKKKISNLIRYYSDNITTFLHIW